MAYQASNQSTASLLQQYQAQLERMQSRKVEQVVSNQPIVGLRVWKVIDDRGLPKLRSVYKETIWPYRKALEKDILDNMGIHAVKPGRRGPSVSDPCAIMGDTDILSLFNSYQADIAGEVYLWGKIEEHEVGYLAEFAYPKRLYPHSDFDPVIAMQLEDEYGVPCEYREEFKKPMQQVPVLTAGSTIATNMQIYPGQIIQVQNPQQYAQSITKQAYQQLAQAQQNAAGLSGKFSMGLLGGLGTYPYGI